MTKGLSYDEICILRLLQEDAQLTNKEIACKLGKSVTAVHEKRKKLEQQGYIKGYVAVLGNKLTEHYLTAIVMVQYKDHHPSAKQNFIAGISKLKEIIECYTTTGEFDAILKVIVSDIHAFTRVSDKIASLPNVSHTRTHIVLSADKVETAQPIYAQ